MSRITNPRNKVLKMYPKAVCKKQPGRIFYDVIKGPSGKVIASACSAVQVWKNAEEKIEHGAYVLRSDKYVRTG